MGYTLHVTLELHNLFVEACEQIDRQGRVLGAGERLDRSLVGVERVAGGALGRRSPVVDGAGGVDRPHGHVPVVRPGDERVVDELPVDIPARMSPGPGDRVRRLEVVEPDRRPATDRDPLVVGRPERGAHELVELDVRTQVNSARSSPAENSNAPSPLASSALTALSRNPAPAVWTIRVVAPIAVSLTAKLPSALPAVSHWPSAMKPMPISGPSKRAPSPTGWPPTTSH